MVLGSWNYADIDLRCAVRGNTALHYAAERGQLRVVLYLATQIADCDVRNHEGKTALDLAASDGVREALAEMSIVNSEDAMLAQSRSQAAWREHDLRLADEAQRRRDQVQRELNKRREEKKAVQPITADAEARAEQAAAELLVAEEEEKRNRNSSHKKKAKKNGRSGKGRKR